MSNPEIIPLEEVSIESFPLEITEETFFSSFNLLLILGVAILCAYIILFRKKTVSRTRIALVGERFSGKSQLFISLNEGKKMETVPSLNNNNVTRVINGNKYNITDYIGDNLSKE